LRLDALLEGVEVRATRGDLADVEVRTVTHDSNAVEPQTIFVCVRGSSADGHDYAPAAVERGAAALVVERFVDVDAPQVLVDASRAALARIAATLHRDPSRSLTVVGVTGTNGKTTTTYLLQAILDAAGERCGVIGSITGARTTPEAPALQAELARLRDAGYRAAAIEVSSAALVARRVDAIDFAAAVFTNLGHDHLGEVHATMDDYFAAKASLFTPERARAGVVNGDDDWGRKLIANAAIPTTPFGFDDAEDLRVDQRGSRFTFHGHAIETALPGRFNVANALAAATTAEVLGIEGRDIAAGLASVSTVPGRFEWIDGGQPFAIAVDYAHTPEALEHALRGARELAGAGRVIVVFGCGGNRDRAKRGPMGQAAAALADVAIVTSDNPRHEDAQAIIDEVVAGAADGRSLVVEPDRERAIIRALSEAQSGDVVVVAGKGHETGQEIGDTVLPFDDRDVVRRIVKDLVH
jgi:UDP-N-acetylmuramoyl-L-alanyl-D-glutamate--2,6-diaminopimelate ligase